MVMVGQPEGRRPLERPKPKWEYNIERGLHEIEWDAVAWINLIKHKNRRHAVLNTIIIHRVTYIPGAFLTS
jgi:hypothetical protein